jgi:UPF0755 protein
MTIRSGGRPRDDRRQAHPLDEDRRDAAQQPDYRRSASPDYGYVGSGGGNGNGRGNGRRDRGGGGFGGILRFLVFALVLAAIVLLLLVTALRPLVRDAVIGWASDNPGALGVPFVADIIREDLGPDLTQPASAETDQVSFTVNSGETASTIAGRLEEEGFLKDSRAFVYIAVEKGLTQQLRTGDFILRRSMTPDQLVTALLDPPEVPYVEIALRTGLRLEQITAKLETIDGLTMDARDFYELAKHPTAELLADFDWLDLPDGASLEGYLWPATYRVLPDTTSEELVRLMLEGFHSAIEDRMTVPAERGLPFREVLTLASIVEREAILDEERPLIAGAFQNRLSKVNGIAPVLGADPTVIYAVDSVKLSEMPLPQWRQYTFWTVPEVGLSKVELPAELEGYNTYRNAGLPPGPICTPTIASIDAALAPDTADEYVYFVAKNDGSKGHAFAKNAAEHQENLVKYGYR